MGQTRYRVLFVCLGNICRSPLAEGLFRSLAKERGVADRFLIESCGTGNWHTGEQAHPTTRAVAKSRGVSLERHRARQVRETDFQQFDLLVAMDRKNERDLGRLRGAVAEKIVLLRNYDPLPDSRDVPDPYSGGADGFEVVHEIVLRCCEQLLDELLETIDSQKK